MILVELGELATTPQFDFLARYKHLVYAALLTVIVLNISLVRRSSGCDLLILINSRLLSIFLCVVLVIYLALNSRDLSAITLTEWLCWRT